MRALRLIALAAPCVLLCVLLPGCKSESHTDASTAAPPPILLPADMAAPPATHPSTPRYMPGYAAPRPTTAPLESGDHRSIEELMQPPIGVTVRVQFRRDAMGLAGTSAIGPETQGLIARSVQLTGKIERLTAEWIELRSDDHLYWIPRNVILLIEVLQS